MYAAEPICEKVARVIRDDNGSADGAVPHSYSTRARMVKLRVTDDELARWTTAAKHRDVDVQQRKRAGDWWTGGRAEGLSGLVRAAVEQLIAPPRKPGHKSGSRKAPPARRKRELAAVLDRRRLANVRPFWAMLAARRNGYAGPLRGERGDARWKGLVAALVGLLLLLVLLPLLIRLAGWMP